MIGSMFMLRAAMGAAGVAQSAGAYPCQRPPQPQRQFVSEAVDAKIADVKTRIKDQKLAWLFENCYPNTLDTTVKYTPSGKTPDTFVITGDIEAMWLRDSSAQVWPYLALLSSDPKLADMVKGLLLRQFKCIQIDPYANAFNDGPTGSHWETDMTEMKKELHERKWEIDSLCYPVRLSYYYWKATGDTSVFGDDWEKSVELTLKTFKEQQRKEDVGPYSFMRETESQGDTMLNKGYGSPVNPVGMIFSAFRPSDDATMFGFLIPSNMFAVVSMRQLCEIIDKTGKGKRFRSELQSLSDEVDQAIRKYGIVDHPEYGKIYAFEVDGYGGRNLMDDANIPSLISIPYIGYVANDEPVYRNTRRFVWSKSNPYFFKGKAGEGIGGPHVGLDYIWPMSIIMKGLTSDDKDEIRDCLTQLVNTDGNTGFMHETFHKEDDTDFTRKWFAWVNTLFGELIVRVDNEYPALLTESYSKK